MRQDNKPNFSILFLGALIMLTVYLCSCKQPVTHPAPVNSTVYVEYFKPGDILLPDYACIDTLIVIDAAGLNKAIAPIEQGLQDATDGFI